MREKPKFDNARRYRVIHFIDLDDEEFTRFMKNAHRNLGIPMSAAMLCSILVHQQRETCATVGQHKTKCLYC